MLYMNQLYLNFEYIRLTGKGHETGNNLDELNKILVWQIKEPCKIKMFAPSTITNTYFHVAIS